MKVEIIANARLLWEYMKLNQPLRKADCLLLMGSHDLRVAAYGAHLFLEGWAPLIVCSGGLGKLTSGVWKVPEGIRFARLARKMGVPENKILVESESTNTGENILFTHRLLEQRGIDPQSFILVHKPYMERRSLATFNKLLPEKDAIVTSHSIPFADYPTRSISRRTIIHIMVGDFQRIMVYPQLGFQTEQFIPAEVMKAYHQLIQAGFTKYLTQDI